MTKLERFIEKINPQYTLFYRNKSEIKIHSNYHLPEIYFMLDFTRFKVLQKTLNKCKILFTTKFYSNLLKFLANIKQKLKDSDKLTE